ncbi:MAG: hypothetical protein R3E68_00325 [Burkholderiaceae bacterium]
MNGPGASRAYATLVPTCLVLCGVLVVFGFSGRGLLSTMPWTATDSLFFFAATVVALFGGFLVLARLLPVAPLQLGLYAVAALGIAAGQGLALLVVAAFALSCEQIGNTLCKGLRIDPDTGAGITPFLVGAGAFGLLLGLLAYLPINTPGLYAALVLLPLLLSRGAVLQRARSWFGSPLPGTTQARGFEPVMAALLAFAVVHFLFALMPELGYDALAMHLFVPSQLYHLGRWGFDPQLYAFALMPMLGDWLFSVGYMLAGETGARLVNLLFTYALSYQGYRLVLFLGGDKGPRPWPRCCSLPRP